MSKKTMVVGWEEWCSLPELGLPILKAKIDSGANTSAIHAFNVVPFEMEGKHYIRFDIHPLQKNRKVTRTCMAMLIDKRQVKNSGGQKEKRYVISSPITMGEKTWNIQITLTNRDSMGYRMLLGREAMRGRVLIDPGESFCQWQMTDKQAKQLYK